MSSYFHSRDLASTPGAASSNGAPPTISSGAVFDSPNKARIAQLHHKLSGLQQGLHEDRQSRLDQVENKVRNIDERLILTLQNEEKKSAALQDQVISSRPLSISLISRYAL